MSEPVVRVLGKAPNQLLMVYCARCNLPHIFPVEIDESINDIDYGAIYGIAKNSAKWLWNGSVNDPLVLPCVHAPNTPTGCICHFFLYSEQLCHHFATHMSYAFNPDARATFLLPGPKIYWHHWGDPTKPNYVSADVAVLRPVSEWPEHLRGK